jgi:hypothetical protein
MRWPVMGQMEGDFVSDDLRLRAGIVVVAVTPEGCCSQIPSAKSKK